MSRRHLAILMFILASLLESQRPAAAQMMVCMPERKKLCADVQLGGGRIADCLRQHEKELSEACHEALYGRTGEAAKAGDDTRAECRADAVKFCNAAIGDPAKMRTCMREHAAELSDGCKTALIANGK